MRPVPSSVRRCAVFLLAAGFVACRCGGQQASTEPATRFIEKGAHGVLFIPSIHDLAGNAQALLGSVREAPGGPLLIKASADLATQLGFDPLTPAGETSAGLDPSRSLAISGIARGEVLMALPYTDLAKLDATVSRLLGTVGRYGTRKATQVNGFSVVTYATADATAPSFAYTTARGFLLLAHGADPVGLAIAAAVRTPELSLASAKEFVDAQTSLGAHDVYVYDLSPEFSRETPLAFRIPERTMLGLSVAARVMLLRVHSPLTPEGQQRAAEFLAAGPTDLSVLPSGLPIYVKGGIDWTAVVHAVEPALARQQSNPLDTLRSVFKDAGIDFDTELAGNLEPGFAFTLGVAQGADLSNALQFDPRQTNPFQNYVLAGVGRVKDAAKATATMGKIGKALAKYGATVVAKPLNGDTVYTVNYQLGEGLSWTLHDKRLIVVGGYGNQLCALIGDMASGRKPLDLSQFSATTRTMLADRGLVVAVDIGKLNDAVAGLRPGSGLAAAGAEMVKSLIGGWLRQLSALRPVVAISPSGDGVNVDVSVSLK